MPNFGLGGPSFGLRDVKVAVWNGDGTYGVLVDVPSVQLFSENLQTVNAQLEGDDVITDIHAKAISGQVKVRFGSVALEVLEVITGRTILSTGVTPNRVDRLNFTGTNFEWFGICGRAESTGQDGDTHLFIPKCKVLEGFEVKFEYGQYTIPELTLMCVPDDQYTINGEDEVQTATITGTPTGGTFTLSFNNAETGNIAYNASAAAVQTALEALTNVGSGNVAVTGSAGGPYTITFQNDLGGQNVAALVSDPALLTGGTNPDVVIATTNEGVEAENVIFVIIEHETAVNVQIPPL